MTIGKLIVTYGALCGHGRDRALMVWWGRIGERGKILLQLSIHDGTKWTFRRPFPNLK